MKHESEMAEEMRKGGRRSSKEMKNNRKFEKSQKSLKDEDK